MTTQPPTPLIDHQTLQAFSDQLRDTFTEIAFQLGAQSTLGALLQGRPHDHIRGSLQRRTTHQLQRIDRAARELIALTNGLLEDRETAEPTQDAAETSSPTGRSGASRDVGRADA